jgi:hypothetical protein
MTLTPDGNPMNSEPLQEELLALLAGRRGTRLESGHHGVLYRSIPNLNSPIFPG